MKTVNIKIDDEFEYPVNSYEIVVKSTSYDSDYEKSEMYKKDEEEYMKKVILLLDEIKNEPENYDTDVLSEIFKKYVPIFEDDEYEIEDIAYSFVEYLPNENVSSIEEIDVYWYDENGKKYHVDVTIHTTETLTISEKKKKKK